MKRLASLRSGKLLWRRSEEKSGALAFSPELLDVAFILSCSMLSDSVEVAFESLSSSTPSSVRVRASCANSSLSLGDQDMMMGSIECNLNTSSICSMPHVNTSIVNQTTSTTLPCPQNRKPPVKTPLLKFASSKIMPVSPTSTPNSVAYLLRTCRTLRQSK